MGINRSENIYKDILRCCEVLFGDFDYDTNLKKFCEEVSFLCNAKTVNLYLYDLLDRNVEFLDEYVCFDLRNEERELGKFVVEGFDSSYREYVNELVSPLLPFLKIFLENKRMHNKLYEMAYYDSLTGLYNRNSLIVKVKEVLSSDDEFGVIVFDVNNLKKVNDEKGHDAGDKLLIQAAGIICNICGKENVYRFGGDEFTAVIKDKELFKNAIVELEKVLNDIMEVSGSFGHCWSTESNDKELVFVLADKRMYKDKQAFYKKFPELKYHY